MCEAEKRATRLEDRLRRWAVSFRVGKFHCDECSGHWTEYENKQGWERHAATCVLYDREKHMLGPSPVAIPF